jgi:hypothetical protein
MRFRRTIKEISSWSWKEWLLVSEACGYLVAARLAVWFVPFRRIAGRLGDKMAESPAKSNEAQRAASAKIGWAVRGLGQHLPFMSQCLVQAVAATWMLQRRRIPSTLYFGVAREDDGEVKAHAWVRSGTQVLTGATGRQDFTVVATFAEPHPDAEPDCPTPR